MSDKKTFSCFIVGAGTLPIQCAEIVLARGHQVYGIVSPDARVTRWAEQHGIPHLDALQRIADFLRPQPFDYLFSIVNESILPKEIFDMPRGCSINYHDALLPRYAGTHATSWAILNHEKVHGVTWHVVSEVVDAGDILKQRSVTIESGETAFSLNTKCYEAALGSFAELVDDLSGKEAEPRKQDLSERTFFPRYKRPAAGCVISWTSSAEAIDALVRALTFGPHPNPLGAARLAIEEDFVIVSETCLLDSISASSPGTVTKIDSHSIRVATTSRELEMRQFFTCAGRPLAVADLAAKYNLVEGYHLANLSNEVLYRIETLNSSISKHEAFWVKRLSALQPASLPFAVFTGSHSKPPAHAAIQMPVPDEVVEFAINRQSWNLSDFLVAAFGAYVSRLVGDEHFDLGYVSDGAGAGFDSLFARFRPLPFKMAHAESFAANFNAVLEQINLVEQRETYARDVSIRYPVLRSKSESGGERSWPVSIEKVQRITDSRLPLESDICLVIPEDRAQCRLVYDRAVFNQADMLEVTRQFTRFLLDLTANPDARLAELALLPQAERQKLLVEWNDTSVAYPTGQCIHQLFEAQALRTPDEVAIVFEDQHLSYSELNQRANQLAHYLLTLGVGPEVFVAICVERSIEMVVGLLGILKAGGAYVPLDPAYPKERLAFMLADSQAPLLLTQQHLKGRFTGQTGQMLCLDADWETVARQGRDNPNSGVSPDNLAYLIYTSGSTGRPKGIAIEHRSPVALLYWARDVYAPEHLAGTLASTSICFDLSVFELFVPLSWGGKIILSENALQLPELPSAHAVTLINTVPSAITELLRIGGIPPSVRIVNLAGEPLQASLVDQIYQQSNTEAVFDLYGPSETTTYSTFTLRRLHGPATIGRPIANTQLYLLDRHLNPTPTGIPGELYIGGAGLARGYLNRPDLTAEKFIHHPFSEDHQSRLYKTGDLARYLPDGNIEFLGRIDHQVKVRGFRIELGEIEAVLAKHPAVDKNAVIVREDTPGEKRLVAYVVAKAGASFPGNSLRDFLKEKLPDHMIPSAIVKLEELPLTPNGKIDRRALPAPDPKRFESERGFVAHRDTLELKLREIWELLLNVKPISVKDNFYDLGGHSLLAVRLFREIERQLGKNLPLATLFQAPTIEQLANLLRKDEGSAPWSSLVPIQTRGSKPPLFCVHAGGGNVLFYRDLSARLGPDQPFYGLQTQGLDGKQPRHTGVEEMATHYIKEIRTVQPEGPYYFGGACFGGLVAFEMARQLHEVGQKVALVVLFDSGAPGYPRLRPSTRLLRLNMMYELIRRVEHHVGSLVMLQPKQRWAYFSAKARKVKNEVRRAIKKGKKEITRKYYHTKGRTLPASLEKTQDAIRQAQQGYVPQVYAGRVTLFRASKQALGIYPDPLLGWSGLATGGLEVYEVPGYHGSILSEPRVRVLAEELKACLRKAQEIHLSVADDRNTKAYTRSSSF